MPKNSSRTTSTPISTPPRRRSAFRSSRNGRPEIRANLDVTFKLAALVGEKELPDDAEPAPVFKA